MSTLIYGIHTYKPFTLSPETNHRGEGAHEPFLIKKEHESTFLLLHQFKLHSSSHS